jgi:hypothetical protein
MSSKGWTWRPCTAHTSPLPSSPTSLSAPMTMGSAWVYPHFLLLAHSCSSQSLSAPSRAQARVSEARRHDHHCRAVELRSTIAVLYLHHNRVCHRLRLAVLRPSCALAQALGHRSTSPPARTPLLRLFAWLEGYGPTPVMLPPPMGVGGQAGARATPLRRHRPSPADIGNHRPPSLLASGG